VEYFVALFCLLIFMITGPFTRTLRAVMRRCARDSNSVYVNGGVHITYSALCVAVLIRVQEVFTGAAQQRATYCERPITVC